MVTRTVLAALRRRPRPVLRLAFWSVPEALPTVLSGYAVARAVDTGFLAGRPAVGLGWLAVLALAVPVGAYGTRRVYRCLADVVEPFRDDLVRHVAAGTLRRAVHSVRPVDGSPVSRLTHQVEIVRDTFAGLVMTVRGFVFSVAGALVGLLSLAPVVVALVAPPVLVGLAGFVAALRAMSARQRAYVLADEDLADGTGIAVRGLRDIAACGAEEQIAGRLGTRVDAQARAERSLAWMTAVRNLCLVAGGWLPLVLLLVATPWLSRRGMSAGSLVGAATYVLHGLQPAVHTLVRGLGGGAVRLGVTLDRLLRASAPAADAGRPAPAAQPTPAGTQVTLSAVTFRYGPHAEPVVADLDLAVPPGDHLAVVGPSGIGKSTLAALLTGVLRPQSGEVRLGGVPLARLDPATLARYRVLIPQEAYVFTGTLRDNLSYLRPGRGDAALATAVAAVGLDRLVDRLGGYDAPLDPAVLRPDERQLVALARAYLAAAPLVVLDEATCHLDPVAEARVERAFADRRGSLVVIAHRISSALRAHRILVLDGTRARLGTHDELLAASALYRDLVGAWRPDSASQPDSSAMRTASSRLRAPAL